MLGYRRLRLPSTVDDMDPAPVWPPVRHPFQVASMGIFVVVGAGWMLGTTSPSIQALLHPTLILLMEIELIVGGTMGLLASVYARKEVALSLLLERAGLTVVGAFALVYTTSLVIRSGFDAWGPAVTYALLAGACVWRWYQVNKYVSWLKRQAEKHPPLAGEVA